ncbi:amidase [Legionella impletisoli]|uniref:Amidase n=1 Tax=Legionella impletisoli TaxID=343510 RepID=A0A917JSG1_9GAMM|nr:amidase [Legionella impletisoli]GGI84728.1 amidase [Legionella impletisoli]
MNVREYIEQDAQSLAKLIKHNEISAEEALDCALARMEEVNPLLNAVVTDCRSWARAQLAQMNGQEPYYGVPILVKDLGYALKGVRNTEGSRFFKMNRGRENSDFIERLLTLGFVPFAMTNTPELGLSYVTEPVIFGPCRNPYDLSRTPGGSSGGSAAAVAAGIAPVATASDGGGSIRIPAACCGLFGFKPTPGLMPTGPWVEEQWSGLATNYILTRHLDDAVNLFPLLTTALNIHHGTERLPSHLTFAKLQGAFPSVPVAKPCHEALDHFTALLNDQGYCIKTITLDLDLDTIGECTLCLIAANTYAEIEQQEYALDRKATLNVLESVTWQFYEQGRTITASQLITAKNKLFQALRPLHQVLNQVDFIVSPALAQLPLPIGQLSMQDDFERFLEKNIEFSPFTSLFNQAGVPAMTIPVCYHDHLPVSVQIAAGKGMDRRLLQLAMQLKPLLPDFSEPQTPKASKFIKD